jgi:predicted ATPase
MIKQLRIGNARLFEGDGWSFDFAQLTAICGTNSAGKSTLLKILLLLRENLLSKETDLGTAPYRLRFTGASSELGSFQAFISQHDSTKDLHLGISLAAQLSAASLVQLGLRPVPLRNVEQLPGAECTLHVDFTFGIQPSNDEQQLSLLGEGEAPTIGRGKQAVLVKGQCRIDVDNLIGFPIFELECKPSTETLSGLFKTTYALRTPRRLLSQDVIARLAHVPIAPDGLVLFSALMRGCLPGYLVGAVRAPTFLENGAIIDEPMSPPRLFQEVISQLLGTLSTIHYLAPLRAKALRYYSVQPDYEAANDVTGEFLPYLLRDSPDMKVSYADPLELQPRSSTLISALGFWLFYLRTGSVPSNNSTDEISIKTVQDILVELEIQSGSSSGRYPLADSGFGYSQVLPILARGLQIGNGATLIIEQPELHLNPALQVRLATFLLSLTIVNKQVLIETHSEHIVDALRASNAEAITGMLDKACMILFIESSDARPKIHNLCVAEDGSVPNWPRGFFAESAATSARILKAQRLHRSRA